MVFAYDFCDVFVVYHTVGGARLCDILEFCQGYLAGLSKENDVADFVLEV